MLLFWLSIDEVNKKEEIRKERNKLKELEVENKKNFCKYKDLKWNISEKVEKIEHCMYGLSIETEKALNINQVYYFLNKF